MKRCLALLLALALTLTLCACAKNDAPPSSETEAPTEPSEPLAVKGDGFGLSYLPEFGLNPFTCNSTVNRAVFSLLYESLFVVSNQFRAEPMLCESFAVSEDGRTYTYTLLSDVTFFDGSAMTAQDAVASITAARSSKLYSGRLSHVTSAYALDTLRFAVTLNATYENFSLMLDVPIVKADTVEADSPIGTGPYALAGTQLRRNSNWWQEREPAAKVDVIPLTAVQTPNELRDNFEFGGTDLVYCDPNAAASVGYRCDFEVWEVPTTVLHYLGFNLKSGPFTSETLRTAVTYMLDRESIANSFYGGFALPTVLPCSPDSDLYDMQLAGKYAYDLPRFQAAVNNSGVETSEEAPGVFLVCSDDPTRVAVAEALIKTFRQCGLYLRLKSVSANAYRSALSSGGYDVYLGEVRLTANFDLAEFFSSNGNLNYGGISDSALTQLCSAALENSGNYPELCTKILESAPICPVVFKSYAIYVTRGKLSSITPAVDCLFHNSATARTLSDADRTYEQTEPSDAPTEE